MPNRDKDDPPDETVLFWRRNGGTGAEVLGYNQGALWVIPCCATREEAPTESSILPLFEPLSTLCPALNACCLAANCTHNSPNLLLDVFSAVQTEHTGRLQTSAEPPSGLASVVQGGCQLSRANTSKHPGRAHPSSHS